MFLLNTAAFFKIVFKVNRWFLYFICKVWTNFCTIRIKMFGNEVCICNSFHLMYDFFREIWLCTSNISYDAFNTFQVFLRYFLWIKIYREIFKSALVYLKIALFHKCPLHILLVQINFLISIKWNPTITKYEKHWKLIIMFNLDWKQKKNHFTFILQKISENIFVCLNVHSIRRVISQTTLYSPKKI